MTPAQRAIIDALARLGAQLSPQFNAARFVRQCEWKLARAKRRTQ